MEKESDSGPIGDPFTYGNKDTENFVGPVKPEKEPVYAYFPTLVIKASTEDSEIAPHNGKTIFYSTPTLPYPDFAEVYNSYKASCINNSTDPVHMEDLSMSAIKGVIELDEPKEGESKKEVSEPTADDYSI